MKKRIAEGFDGRSVPVDTLKSAGGEWIGTVYRFPDGSTGCYTKDPISGVVFKEVDSAAHQGQNRAVKQAAGGGSQHKDTRRSSGDTGGRGRQVGSNTGVGQGGRKNRS